jgi:predicted amidophosphoribosyltransferase
LSWTATLNSGAIQIEFNHRKMGSYNLISKPACEICSYPLTLTTCPRSDSHSPFLKKTYTIGLYNKLGSGESDLLSKHIYNLKHYSAKAEPLGRAIVDLVRTRDSELAKYDMIAPVPKRPDELHVDKFSGVLFNQAELLADAIAEGIGVRKVEALVKTRSQSMRGSDGKPLSADARWTATEGLYEADKIVEGRTVLVVDDVATSSSTLRRVAMAIIKMGGMEVSAYVCGINNFL